MLFGIFFWYIVSVQIYLIYTIGIDTQQIGHKSEYTVYIQLIPSSIIERGGYRGIQGDTGGYRGIQGDTGALLIANLVFSSVLHLDTVMIPKKR